MESARRRSDARPRREAAAGIGYVVAYIGYLFAYPEGEVCHWLSLVAIPGLGLAFLRSRREGWDTRGLLLTFGIGERPPARGVAAALVVGCAVSLMQLLGRNGPAIRELIVSGRAAWALPASILLMTITAATTEEFFFRGVLQSRLSAILPIPGGAIMGSALLFSAYHVPYAYRTSGWGTQGDLAAAGQAALATGFPMGILLGAVFALGRRNLAVAILAHALINALPGMLVVSGWFGR